MVSLSEPCAFPKVQSTTVSSNNGEFSIKVKFDEKIYHYFLVFDYVAGTARIETAAMPRGRENGRILPESIKTIFTEEFVKRFVFDGEQAEKSMDTVLIIYIFSGHTQEMKQQKTVILICISSFPSL